MPPDSLTSQAIITLSHLAIISERTHHTTSTHANPGVNGRCLVQSEKGSVPFLFPALVEEQRGLGPPTRALLATWLATFSLKLGYSAHAQWQQRWAEAEGAVQTHRCR